jgi:P4 family phage/plasmid primase-like protien
MAERMITKYFDLDQNKEKINNIREIYYQLNMSESNKTYLKEKLYTDICSYFVDIYKIYFDGIDFWIWDFNTKKYNKLNHSKLDVLFKKYIQTLNQEFSFRITCDHSTQRSLINLNIKRTAIDRNLKKVSPDIISFKNTDINVRTNEYITLDENYFVKNRLKYDLGDSEDTPVIDKIFKEWVGEEHYLKLQEIAAYCFIRNYPLNRFFILVGDGCNGKSKYVEFLENIVGKENTTVTDLTQLTYNRFETSSFKDKMICFISETEKIKVKDTAIIKSLTSNDPIRAEEKFKEKQEFISYAKIIIHTNNIPTFEDDSDGFKRRLKLIVFPNKFTEKKDVLEQITEKEYSNFCKKAVRLANNIIVNRKFESDTDNEIENNMKVYYSFIYKDMIEFIDEKYDPDNEKYIPFSEITKDYQEYFDIPDNKNSLKTKLGSKLNKLGYKKSNYPINNTSRRVVWGLKQKNS